MDTLEKKFVIGISMRTSNENGRFLREAPTLFGRFHQENVTEKIPNKLSSDLLAIYTEYEGDHTKPYTYLIGYEVSSLETIPEGMQGIEIPASSYALFVAQGEFPKSMMETWQTIWNSPLRRSYTTDFEVYSADFNMQNPEVKIYIAVQP